MRPSLLLSLLLLGCGLRDDLPAAAESPLRINEIFANGSSDADWVELYNEGSTELDLEGYRLDDGGGDWQIPAQILAPGGYLVIICDGGEEEGHADFKLSSGGESLSLKDPEVALVETITFGIQEVDRSWARGEDGTWAPASPSPGEANGASAPLLDQGLPPDGGTSEIPLWINEVMSKNESYPDPQGEAGDWIELYNGGEAELQLEGFILADDLSQWRLPAQALEAGGFLLIWADEQDSGLHSNFKLSKGGELLRLLDPEERELDRIDIPALEADQSYGRTPDGGAGLGILSSPSPNASNQ